MEPAGPGPPPALVSLQVKTKTPGLSRLGAGFAPCTSFRLEIGAGGAGEGGGPALGKGWEVLGGISQ